MTDDIMISPQCAKCGDTRGGQPGHETSECDWAGKGPRAAGTTEGKSPRNEDATNPITQSQP